MARAWYYNYKEYLVGATSFFKGMDERIVREGKNKDLETDSELLNFFQDLQKEDITKFIFESNNIEEEGLKEGMTQKLVFDLVKEEELDEILQDFSKRLFNVKYEIIPKKSFNPKKLDLNDFDLIMRYKGKKKDIGVAMNSFVALMVAREFMSDYTTNLTVYMNNEEKAKKLAKAMMNSDYIHSTGSLFSKFIRFIKSKNDDGNYLISEEKIKKLHKTIAEGLDNNKNGDPGEYRPHPAHAADYKTVYMEPVLIEKSMGNLIKNYQERYKKPYYNPFVEACKLTGDFNIIHPFGDFNGRIGRILLNMILQFEMMPFYLILRSVKKDKHRYITAMKHYYNGKPNTYLALVCMTFIERMNSINSRLELAGIEAIEPVKLKKHELEMIDKALQDYQSTSRPF
ncbi:MAG: Fic family protein [Methanobacterium formicicum]|uniref:Fic family protein n=1 Tax=Methanobacterium formicicum TaxID=2162 RepID=UPI003530F4C3